MHIFSDIPDAARREATAYVDSMAMADEELRGVLIEAVRYSLLVDRFKSRGTARRSCGMTPQEALRGQALRLALGKGRLRCADGTIGLFAAEVIAGVREADGSPKPTFFSTVEILDEERRHTLARQQRMNGDGGAA